MARAKMPAEDPQEEQYVEEPLEEAYSEPETGSDKFVAVIPWWFISFLLHSVLLTISMFIYVIQAPPQEEEIVQVAPPRKPPPEPEIEKPKDLEFAKKFLNVEKSVEDPIFKRAEESDHNESDDAEDFQSMKGDSTDFKSDKPFKGYGCNDSIGVGGGGGGRYGTRYGGRKNLVNRGGGNDQTEGAVLSALKWLSRHQNDDGSWSMTGYLKNCGKVKKYVGTRCEPHGVHTSVDTAKHNYDTGLTGLALLAFLGAGYTHSSKETYDGICFGDVVKNGLQFLLHNQDGDGCIGSRDIEQYMYNHTIACLALSEAYGLTGGHKFKDPAQKAVDFICAAQNPGKGWRYIFQAGENDSSVTGWAVMALKSADLSGLHFDKQVAYDGARAWFDQVTYKPNAGGGTGGTTRYKAGYQFNSDADVFIPGVNDQFNQHPSMTAIMSMCRIFMDKKKSAEVVGAGEVLLEDLPKWDGNAIDYYYWYYASLALYQFDGPEGPKWRAWNQKMVESLVKNQQTASAGDKNGSWEPIDRWSCKGGRVYAVAINALTLEVYYRYASVFGGKTN